MTNPQDNLTATISTNMFSYVDANKQQIVITTTDFAAVEAVTTYLQTAEGMANNDLTPEKVKDLVDQLEASALSGQPMATTIPAEPVTSVADATTSIPDALTTPVAAAAAPEDAVVNPASASSSTAEATANADTVTQTVITPDATPAPTPVTPTPTETIPPITTAPVAPAVDTSTVSSTGVVFPPNIGTNGKIVLQTLDAYIHDMQPGKSVRDNDILRHQRTLYNAIITMVNHCNHDFDQVFDSFLKAFHQHRKGALGEMHVFRGMDNIQLNEKERDAFARLLNMFRLMADPAGRQIAKRQFDPIKTLEHGVSEQGRQRIMTFFNIL